MDYEQKYKEALETVQEILSSGADLIRIKRLKLRLQSVFPELKESKDERIRKGLIKSVSRIFEGHKLYDTDVTREEALAWLEKQSEQPTDKVETKFKVGDWITSGGYTWKIVEVKPLDYILQSQDGNIVDDTISYVDEHFHLWTIADAKDGDILAVDPIDSYPFPFVAIYKERGLDFFNSYCFISFDGKFYEADEGHSTEEIHPATKGQRDLLSHKMKEAGYKWDSEKKELKKIEVVSKESEDEMIRKTLIEHIKGIKSWNYFLGISKEQMIAWLKKQDNKSVNIDVESMVNLYEQRLESQCGKKYSPLVNMCLTAFRHGIENVLEELNLKKLEKQGELKVKD